MFSIFSLFRPASVADIRREQLQTAQLYCLEHSSAAEHHQALASMYAKRVQRLRAETEENAEEPPLVKLAQPDLTHLVRP